MATDRNNPQLESVIAKFTALELERAETCFQAVCTTDEDADNMVTVQPAIRILARNGTQTNAKPKTIPVRWPSWQGFVLQGRLKIGDEVSVQCQDKNWNAWLQQGGVVDNTQPDGRRAGYAYAEPTMISEPSRPGALPDGVVLRLGRKDALTTVELNSDGSIRLAATDVFLTAGDGLGEFLRALQLAISGWAPVPNDGGAALKVALAAWLASTPPTGGAPPPP